MAHGGDVSRCSGPHQKTCEYFAEGGAPAAVGGGEPPSLSGQEAPPEDGAPAPAVGPGAGEIQDLTSGKEAPPEDDVPAGFVSGEEAPEDDTPPEPGSHSLPTSVGDAALRVIGRNGLFTTPDAEGARGEKWDTPEGVRAMNDKFENEGRIGSIVTGAGAVRGAEAIAGGIAKAADLGVLGTAAIKGAISNGLIQATDEVSKWMMGENPEHPVAAVIAASGLGGLFGIAGSAANTELKALSNAKIQNKAASIIAGFGAAAKDEEMPAADWLNKEAFAAGQKYYKYVTGAAKGATILGSGLEGYHEDGIKGAAKRIGEAAILNRALGWTGRKIAVPVIMKVLTSDIGSGIVGALSHVDRVIEGVGSIDTAIEGLFGTARRMGGRALGDLENENDRQRIEDMIEGGGPIQDAVHKAADYIPEGFAEGGMAQEPQEKPNGVATHFPEQNILMNAAKARASGYLNSLRPAKVHPKLAFDDNPDTREQEKTYKRALGIAAKPLSVLEKVGDGTIEPEHVKHLSAMYPEVAGLLQKKIVERISQEQLKEKKPSYKVRQGLSLLLGTPLSGEMLPQNIQAAQATFAIKKADTQEREPVKKKSTSSLSNSDKSFLTSAQAREAREQRSH